MHAIVCSLSLLAIAAEPAVVTGADPQECERQALAALQSGTLDEAGATAAWLERGRCFLAASDPDRAERAFAAALRITPDSPALPDDAFVRAQASALPDALSFTAHQEAGTVSIALRSDDLQLAKSAALFAPGPEGLDEVARVPLEVGHARHAVSGLPAAPTEARLLDKWGNVLRRVSVTAPAAPAAQALAPTGTTAPGISPGALSYAGAATLAVGILGMTTCGVGAASAGTDALQQQPLWFAGLGAGAVLFAAGGALVILDQGL